MTKPANGEMHEHIRRLDVLGYTVVPAFLSAADTASLRETVVALHEKLNAKGKPSAVNTDEGLVVNLQNKDKRFIDLLSDTRLEVILRSALNDPHYAELPEDCPNYILGELIARSSGQPLRLHMDSWMPAQGPNTWMLQTIFALEDRGVKEGCSLVVPGSHRIGKYTDREFPAPEPLPAKAGDLIVWDSRLWHGALPRTTNNPGWVVVATMQRWWVKPRYDIPRSLPEAIFSKLTSKQKVMLGYCSMPPMDEDRGIGPKQGYDLIDYNRSALTAVR